MQEKEIKVQIKEDVFKKLARELEDLYPKKVINQKDEYYDTEELFLTNLCRGLRVRYDSGIPAELEYKALFFRPKLKKFFVEEIPFELPLSEREISKMNEVLKRLGLDLIPLGNLGFQNALSAIGLIPMITVTKARSEFVSEKAVYTLDHIQEAGHFLEIEVKDQSLEPADLLSELLTDSMYTPVQLGYNETVASKYDMWIPNSITQRLFRLNPYWNVLDSEREYVERLLS